jgi:hypothetical protein
VTKFNPSDYNPRYLRYAANHGRGPIEMSAHDDEAWPGGRMVGFMLWISAAWQAFDAANGIRRGSYNELIRGDVARRAGFADAHAMFDQQFLATYTGRLDADGKVIECRS